MRAAVKYGALATLGSLVLSALVVAPASNAAGSDTRAAGTHGAGTAAGAGTTTAERYGVALAAERAAAAGITFGTCPKNEMLPPPITCGTVKVPLDYAAPDGHTIALTVSRVRASGKPQDRQGAFVFNPGGPGASSMYFPMAAVMPEWKRIAAAYDIVGYAPRGVGHSAPLSCEDPADFAKAPTQSPRHPSESYKRERIAEAKAYAQGCADRAGAALPFYTSLNNARDLDVLRAALGEQKLTFMGSSYGTYFGALYATLFPSHVRRMVFDSAVDPDPGRSGTATTSTSRAPSSSAGPTSAPGSPSTTRRTTWARTRRPCRRATSRCGPGWRRNRPHGKVGPGQLQAAMLGAGYYDDYWAMRATALSEFVKGNEQPLIEQASPQPAAAVDNENGNAVYTAVECNDAPWPTDWHVWDRDNTALAARAPFETWDNAWMNLPCAYWPAPRQQPVDVRTWPGQLPPTLILAAERDAATPYPGALELQKRLAGSVLVTERNAGTHGIAGGSNACVNTYVEDYLLTGRTPVRRAECAPHAEPNPVSLDGRSGGRKLPPVV